VDLALLLVRVFAVVVLYGFLLVLLAIVWRDLRQAATERPMPLPQGRLVVVEAGEDGPEPGTNYLLQEVTSLGRTPANTINTIVLLDPFVSAHHALLTWREGRWWVEDQGSRNGTTLNDELIDRPTVVSPGDLIGIGRAVLRLDLEE